MLTTTHRFGVWFYFVGLLAVWNGRAKAADDGRPNVLFLFADDQRQDTIGAWGNDHIATPNVDKLVARGFSFHSNHCMGSMHGAVCQPSRAMLMSGRSLYHVPMDLEGAVTLPQLLGANGYATFGTGKWHNGAPSFLRSFQHGTAAFMGGMANHLKVPVADVSEDGTKLVNKRTGGKFSTEMFADSVIDFLSGYDGEKPFFAYVAFTSPHDPRMPPQPFRQYYYDHRPPLPGNFMPQHPFNNGWMTGRDESLAPWPRTPEVVGDQLAEYYAMIAHLDTQVGRILEALESAGHADDTIIIYSADHGLAVGSHGLLGKQNLYEHSMGCPLIIAGPGIPCGSSDALTYLLDLYPTLCDVIGVTPPESIEGASLKPIWEGKSETVRDTLYTTYEDKMRAVRDSRWKLIRYPQINYTQLFDLQNDPLELQNHADEPVQAERIETMVGWLRDWQQRTSDNQPLSVEHPQPMEIDLTGHERKPDPHQPEWIVEKYFR